MTQSLKTVLFCIISLCFISTTSSCVILGTMFYNDLADNYYFTKTFLEIKNDPAVLDVMQSSDFQFPYSYSYVRIIFNDGGIIGISNYTRKREVKGRPMYINYVNNYILKFYSRDKEDFFRGNDLAHWSAVIGVRLETIVDVAKNYHVICEHMERFTDLTADKQDKESEAARLKRIVENNLYSDAVIVDGQEYILLKYALR